MLTSMKIERAFIAISSLMVLLVCGCSSQTTIVLEADADSVANAWDLSVRVCDQEGLLVFEGAELASSEIFPSRIPVLPHEGDSSRVFALTATLTDIDGQEVQMQRVFASFPENGEERITRRFEAVCAGVLNCLEHQTCIAGACHDARDVSFDASFDLAAEIAECSPSR